MLADVVDDVEDKVSDVIPVVSRMVDDVQEDGGGEERESAVGACVEGVDDAEVDVEDGVDDDADDPDDGTYEDAEG